MRAEIALRRPGGKDLVNTDIKATILMYIKQGYKMVDVSKNPHPSRSDLSDLKEQKKSFSLFLLLLAFIFFSRKITIGQDQFPSLGK